MISNISGKQRENLRPIDRRLDGKGRNIPNKERLNRRVKDQLRKKALEIIQGRSITDMDKGEKINIPARDLSEPVFGYDPRGGVQERVLPGNREFVCGDRIARPSGGMGSGNGSGRTGNSGEGEDDFVFELSREEFLNLFFEDLELPNLVRTQLAKMVESVSVRAGFSVCGSKMDVGRSLKRALARRIGMGVQKDRHRLECARKELLEAREKNETDLELELLKEIKRLEGRMRVCPFFDERLDARYAHREHQFRPTTQAAVFFLMDVSGSMTQARKDLAKRFFALLYLFLKRNYEKVEVVFVRHDTTAKEVSEKEFFFETKNGGTEVSSGIKMVADIIDARYPVSSWNLYVAQASDGENWGGDSPKCKMLLLEKIMPRVRYYAYVEVTPDRHQDLWECYEEGVRKEYPKNFAMRQIDGPADIYPVFRELFKRRAN